MNSLGAAIFAVLVSSANAADFVGLEPSQDNTLYEPETGQTETSNGAGQYLFVGRTGTDAQNKLRRALLAFDIAAAIPSGATIVYVDLTLHMSKAPTHPATPSPVAIDAHRLSAAWGEGTADALGAEGQGAAPGAQDATWSQRFFGPPPQAWAVLGGDFVAQPSASATVGLVTVFPSTAYTMSCTGQLVADVQAWLDDPGSNYGWILVNNGSPFSARRFNSRENAAVDTRPRLTVGYLAPNEVFIDDFEEAPVCDG